MDAVSSWSMDRAGLRTMGNFFFGDSGHTLVRAVHLESLCFSVPQIEKLIESNPALADSVKAGSFGLDREHHDLFMSEPELLAP
jgi:hypothetical protein